MKGLLVKPSVSEKYTTVVDDWPLVVSLVSDCVNWGISDCFTTVPDVSASLVTVVPLLGGNDV